jgi:hypothetical protein
MKDIVDANLDYSSTTDADTLRFIYMESPANAFVIDGIVSGFFVVYNADASNSSTLDSYTVSLRSTPDASSSETTLGSMTNSVSKTVGTESYYYAPIYFDVDEKDIGNDEKLLVYLSISHTSGDLEFSHANDSTSPDLQIQIPFP